MRRGQSLVITVMIMLVVVLMVFFTFSVGERTRKKTRMQALADSAAYSGAVAEARAMNYFAFSNRAIVSDMVSVLSVSSHNTWTNWYEDALAAAVQNWLNIAATLHGRALADPACTPCSVNLLNAANRAFDIAEWYAFAMPTGPGGIALFTNYMAPGLPVPWPPFNNPYAGKVWVLSGGTPVRVGFAGNNWSRAQGTFDDGCYNLKQPYNARNGATSGGGAAARCESQMSTVRGARGAEWMHKQFHSKQDGDWCALMGMGRRQHFDTAIMQRAQQLNVERELTLLLRGSLTPRQRVLRERIQLEDLRDWLFTQSAQHVDTDPSDNDGTEGVAGGAIDLYDAKNQTGGSVAVMPLAQRLARKVDPRIDVTIPSAELSADLFLDSVVAQYAPGANPRTDPVDPARAMSHRDFDQMEFTARYPQWVYQRRVEGFSDHLLRERNWQTLHNGAQRLAGGSGTVQNLAWYWGNGKALSIRELPLGVMPSSRSPGIDVYAPAANEWNNEGTWWNYTTGALFPLPWQSPVYRASSAAGQSTGQAINNWYTWVPVQGTALVNAVRDESLTAVFGRNFGHGTEDHGRVYSEFQVGSGCAASCDDARSTIVQRDGRDASWNRGDGEAPKGIHFFHGEAPAVGHRMGSLNQSTDHQYVGHMRFDVKDDPDQLWNFPRTVVMLTEAAKDLGISTGGVAGRRPWDFDFSAPIFGDLKFKTVDTQGDALSGDSMAAAASGLVYYHQPTRWQEPPNLWNPFWRAKLHPLKRLHLINAGHAPTSAAVSGLPPGAVNE